MGEAAGLGIVGIGGKDWGLWEEALSRFVETNARGPEGVDHLALAIGRAILRREPVSE